MAVYGVSSTLGPPFALVVMGFVDFKFGWRVVFWANMGIFGGWWLIMLVCTAAPYMGHFQPSWETAGLSEESIPGVLGLLPLSQLTS